MMPSCSIDWLLVRSQALNSMALGHFLTFVVVVVLCFLSDTITDNLQMKPENSIFLGLSLPFLFSKPVARRQGNGKRWDGLGGTGSFAI